jgi:hypothetical protein
MAFGGPDPNADIVDSCLERARALDIKPRTAEQGPLVVLTTAGPVTADRMPVKPFECTSKVKAIVDKILGHNEPLNLAEIKTLLDQKRYADLPDIIKPRGGADQNLPPIKMQMSIRPNEDGTYDLIKHFVTPYRVDVEVLLGMCHGEPMQITYLSPQVQLSKKCFQYLLELMGGLGIYWDVMTCPAQDETDKAIDDGYDYIEKTAPRTTAGTAFLRWKDKSIEKSTPIQGWSEARIEKAWKAILANGVLAKIRKIYPCTLKQLHPGFLQYVLGPLLPGLRKNSLVMLGKNMIGKTPVLIITCFGFARFWITKDGVEYDPEVRVAPDLDFFRGDPGTKYSPFIFDDGDVNELETRKLKAFLDVGEDETMTRERWGASKFVKNQLRGLADNTYDESAVPDYMPNDLPEEMSRYAFTTLAVFTDIVRPAFGKKTLPNIGAVFKRAHFIVNTESYIFVKQAADDTIKVFHGLDSYLTVEAGEALIEFKNTDQMPPSEQYRADIEWEQNLITRLCDQADGRRVRRRWAGGVLMQ